MTDLTVQKLIASLCALAGLVSLAGAGCSADATTTGDHQQSDAQGLSGPGDGEPTEGEETSAEGEGAPVEGEGVAGEGEGEGQPAPDHPRAVLIAHGLGEASGLTVLTLDVDGTLLNPGLHLTVGPKPNALAFTPDGKYAAVLSSESQQAALVKIDSPGGAQVLQIISTPNRFPETAFFLDNTRLIYVNGNIEPEGGVYAMDLQNETLVEDASYHLPLRVPRGLAQLDNPNEVLTGYTLESQENVIGRFLLDGTAGNSTARPGDGVIIASLAAKGDNGILLLYDLFSGASGAIPIDLKNGAVTLGELSAIEDPAFAAFHPAGQAVAVTNAAGNRVLSYRVQDAVLTAVSEHQVDLADSIDMVRRGSLAGLCLVTYVSATSDELGVAITDLAEDGTLTEPEFYSIGTGVDLIPSAVAIQP